MKFAHWRMSRQTSPALPMYEPQIGAQAPVPDEVLRYIMVLSDAHTLAMLNRVSAGMRSVVKTSFTVTVRNALLPFLPAHKLQGFFDCLTECRGVIFGDVALRVQTRARWTLSGMSIAVARGNAIPMVGWLTTCGYVKRPVSRPQNWGTHYIYGIQHEVVSCSSTILNLSSLLTCALDPRSLDLCLRERRRIHGDPRPVV